MEVPTFASFHFRVSFSNSHWEFQGSTVLFPTPTLASSKISLGPSEMPLFLNSLGGTTPFPGNGK